MVEIKFMVYFNLYVDVFFHVMFHPLTYQVLRCQKKHFDFFRLFALFLMQRVSEVLKVSTH